MCAAGITLIGYVFGANLDTVEKILSRFGWGILALIVIGVATRIWWKRRHPGPTEETTEGPAEGS